MKATIFPRVSALLLAAMVVAAAVVVGVVLLFYPSLVSAQTTGTTIKVNTKADGTKTGNCSLREAIAAANSNTAVDRCAAGSDAEQDAILFSLGDKATITLGSTLPTITDDAGLTIDGRKAKITVSGSDAVRVFEVDPGGKLTLKNLTVAHASTDDDGGALSNNGGTLVVDHSTFSNNRSGFRGGGIHNLDGTLTVTNSTFSDNSAVYAGGVYNSSIAKLTMTNSTLSGNSAEAAGGGIANDPLSTVEVTNSTFSGNNVGGNTGGSAGIYNLGTLTVTSSTFSNNGIHNDQRPATLSNTILANVPSPANNCSGTMTDGGYNISDDGSCNFTEPSTSKNDTDPLLDPNGLQKNGGPTKTIKLLGGSPAINAIPEATNGCGTEITTDQRGVSRPQGSGCEIGAFEKKVR